MTLRSRGIRGHVYEMRNHKLNSPKTRRFAFTNIVSVTKDFQTPRSIIRRPFLILKTIFSVGLSLHIYRVLYFTGMVLWSSNEKLEWHHFNTMQPKTVTVAQVKMMEHKRDFDPLFGLLSTIFWSWPQVLSVWFCRASLWTVRGRASPWTVGPLTICLLYRPKNFYAFFSTVSVFNFWSLEHDLMQLVSFVPLLLYSTQEASLPIVGFTSWTNTQIFVAEHVNKHFIF